MYTSFHYTSIHPAIHPSGMLSFITATNLLIYPSKMLQCKCSFPLDIHPFIHLSINPSIHACSRSYIPWVLIQHTPIMLQSKCILPPTIHPSINPSIHPSTHSSIHLLIFTWNGRFHYIFVESILKS
jgi:hypothetical protein